MIVLDTNVVSELMRSPPDAVVVEWVRASPAETLYTTSITVAEILYGIERLPGGRRRTLLLAAARDLFSSFADRVLVFDVEAAGEYASLVSERERAGRPIGGFDAQIAAICRGNGATLATRNLRDFRGTVNLIDPWRASR